MIILMICIVIYYIARGCIEGYTFTQLERKLSNIFINPGGKHRLNSKGIFDYHTWRAIEQVAIMGAIGSAFFTNTNMWTFILLLIASISIGWTLFECIINYICHDNIDQYKDFTIGKYTIPVPAWVKYMGVSLGVVIIVLVVML